MSLTFQSGTTVILSDGVTSRELLVSSCSVSQTYLEESRSVKTLHSLNNVSDTFSNSKSEVSVEFSTYLTKFDSLLLTWFGSSKSADRYNLQHIGSAPNYLDIYIRANGSVYKVTKCVAASFVFSFDGRSGPLGIAVTAKGSDLSALASLPALTITKQSYSDFITGGLTFSGLNTYIAGLTLEMNKSVSWVSDKTVHSVFSGGFYVPTNATLSEITIGGTLTRYKTNNTLPAYSTNFTVSLNYGGKFLINLSPCKMLSRWDTSDVVHKVMQDFKLLPNISTAYLEFL